ncbi:MAG: hypothetical protein FWD65_06025 [Coriobacteriia bacterium]|nr:hypothetical protein [Coriobacteriia bacterium]
MAYQRIWINSAAFTGTLSAQKTAILCLENGHNAAQAVFSNINAAWIGLGKAAFNDCAKEITLEALEGIFMASTMNTDANNALQVYGTTDQKMATAIANSKFALGNLNCH